MWNNEFFYLYSDLSWNKIPRRTCWECIINIKGLLAVYIEIKKIISQRHEKVINLLKWSHSFLSEILKVFSQLVKVKLNFTRNLAFISVFIRSCWVILHIILAIFHLYILSELNFLFSWGCRFSLIIIYWRVSILFQFFIFKIIQVLLWILLWKYFIGLLILSNFSSLRYYIDFEITLYNIRLLFIILVLSLRFFYDWTRNLGLFN